MYTKANRTTGTYLQGSFLPRGDTKMALKDGAHPIAITGALVVAPIHARQSNQVHPFIYALHGEEANRLMGCSSYHFSSW